MSAQKVDNKKGGDYVLFQAQALNSTVENVQEKKALSQATIKHNQALIAAQKRQFKDKKPSPFHKVSLLSIVLSIRLLAVMLKSGLPIEDSLKVLSEQAQDVKLRMIYREIMKDVLSGNPMADSMTKYSKVFPGIVISLISAGEQGGTLEKNLIFLADYLKQDFELKKKIKGAIFYPLVVLGITVFEGLGVIFFILPKLDSLFSTIPNLPFTTQMIVGGAKFIRENVLLISIAMGILGFAFVSVMKTKFGKKVKDQVDLNFPILKILNRDSILTTLARTLGILLESGIPIADAMKIASKTIGNGIYSRLIYQAHEDVKGGRNLSDVLLVWPKYFPPTFVKMVQVGEQTGTLEDNLMYLHEFYAEDVKEMSNNLTTLMEPLLLVFIGIAVGILAVSIIGPIYSLTSAIDH